MSDTPILPAGFRFGVDRERGTRILETDAHGDDAYRRIIEGLRAGDRSVLRP